MTLSNDASNDKLVKKYNYKNYKSNQYIANMS